MVFFNIIFTYLFLIPVDHLKLISLNGVMSKDAMIKEIIPFCALTSTASWTFYVPLMILMLVSHNPWVHSTGATLLNCGRTCNVSKSILTAAATTWHTTQRALNSIQCTRYHDAFTANEILKQLPSTIHRTSRIEHVRDYLVVNPFVWWNTNYNSQNIAVYVFIQN